MADSEKKKGKGLIIILLALIIIGAAVFAGVYFALSSNNSTEEEVTITEAYFAICEESTVNLDDGSYVKATVYASYDSENTDLAEELTSKSTTLQDTVIFYLKSLTAEDFAASNEDTLKSQLVSKLNESLSDGVIIDVQFTELIVQ